MADELTPEDIAKRTVAKLNLSAHAVKMTKEEPEREYTAEELTVDIGEFNRRVIEPAIEQLRDSLERDVEIKRSQRFRNAHLNLFAFGVESTLDRRERIRSEALIGAQMAMRTRGFYNAK